MKNKSSNRRNFLKLGVAAGATALIATGSNVLSALNDGGSDHAAGKETGEKMKVLTPDGKLVEVDKGHICCQPATSQESRQGLPDKKMVMVIDLAKCRNARKCIEGCQAGHQLPAHMEWIKIYLMRGSQEMTPYWFPKPCLHCNNPPCVKVCPVGATFKRTDGIVLVDNLRCIGCKFCMAACPYASRVFNWEKPEIDKELHQASYSPETSSPLQLGTVSKCDFCPDLVRKGELPHCVVSCPNGVFYYGDKNEDVVTNGTETVRFSELIDSRAAYRFMEELGTDPSIYYLPAIDRAFDYKVGFEGLSQEEIDLYKKEAKITE